LTQINNILKINIPSFPPGVGLTGRRPIVTCPFVPQAASLCPSASRDLGKRAGLAGGRACNGRRGELGDLIETTFGLDGFNK